ncbi:hypothetical protein ECZU51_46790 [Escherichia coli]|nr:hypothetical protein ECZU51_46790 [Escherichia coli]
MTTGVGGSGLFGDAGRNGRAYGRAPAQIRDMVEDALQDSFDEYDTHPWVVQFYCQDENDVDAYLDYLKGYVKPHAQERHSRRRLGEMARHLRGLPVLRDCLRTPVTGQPRRTAATNPDGGLPSYREEQ